MVTMEDVRRGIDPDEPDYNRAAAELGPEALPFLAELAQSYDGMLASKAVSLAGMIGGEGAVAIIERAVDAAPPEIRVVAAAAAGRLGDPGEAALVRLLADGDVGVRKYAVGAVPGTVSPRLRAALEYMRTVEPDPGLRLRVDAVLRRR